MNEQNYSNHKRYVIGYHFITFALILIIFLFSIYNLAISVTTKWGVKIAIILLLISLVLISIFFYLRIFVAKAQNRAIRAEENLRHFALTGKLLDPKLKISQIIALRFAPDAEFVELSQKAVNENLSNDDIKKAIKNWRADHERA